MPAASGYGRRQRVSAARPGRWQVSGPDAFGGLDDLAGALASGRATSRALTLACLDRIAEPAGEGRLVFPHGPSDQALADADRQDALRKVGRSPSPYAGVPISIKDNIDQAGQVTRAGSRLLAGDAAAATDALVVARLRAAGFVIVGRTAMTELAFSGLGLNPHYGTPANPRSPEVRRIPGGSSAGAAVSVATGMAWAAVGTDTGGSCRIPAAFCGLVGWKPTASRIPRAGVFPLSSTLDSVGALGLSVRCCAIVDAVMAGEALPVRSASLQQPELQRAGLQRPSLQRPRLGALTGYVLEDLDEHVRGSYATALERFRSAGFQIDDVESPALSRVAEMNSRGGFSSIELHRHLQRWLNAGSDTLDPRVLRRIQMGADRSIGDHQGLHFARSDLIQAAAEDLDAYDAILMPTTPTVAPRFDELDTEDAYDRINLQALRNASIVNMLDRCAITLPCEPRGQLPVGLTLMGRSQDDSRLLDLAAALETGLKSA